MQSIDYNLSLLDIMLDDFEAYILSKVLYWPLSMDAKRDAYLPRLTLGGLYLTLDELASQQFAMNQDQETQYHKLIRKFDQVISKWQVCVEQKAQQELSSRLNLWQAYLRDLEDDPDLVEDYPRAVRIRVMIGHLIDLSGSSQEVKEKTLIISSLDQRFNDFVKPNDFLWDAPLKLVYPQEKFPYLYRSPRNLLFK